MVGAGVIYCKYIYFFSRPLIRAGLCFIVSKDYKRRQPDKWIRRRNVDRVHKRRILLFLQMMAVVCPGLPVPSTLTWDHLTIKIRTQQSEVENVMCETGAAALKHETPKHKNNVLFAIDWQFYPQNPPFRFDTFGDIIHNAVCSDCLYTIVHLLALSPFSSHYLCLHKLFVCLYYSWLLMCSSPSANYIPVC